MNRFGHRVKIGLTRAKGLLSTQKNSVPDEEPPLPQFIAHFNSPQSNWIEEKTLTISGWLLPEEATSVRAIRAKNNEKYIDIPYGLKRHDVPKAYPLRDAQETLRSGFSKKITYEEGSLCIEVDLGKGWQLVKEFNLKYSPEQLVDMIYDPELSLKSAEHANLLEGKSKYYFEASMNGHYDRHEDDPRLVALYLPQFHPIEENDKFWGKGFTEWTNVSTAKPRFVGHQQPILPSDLGFYDLRLDESIQAQIELAKKHGIYGFCFYYYWFSGKKLLEKPLDILLKHKEWDFNFMISWANENWTKRWDGLDNEVIIEQKYLKDDPLNFIKDVEHILLDERYIREENKPVLIVYRGSKLGDPARYIKVWREYFREKHNQELHIISVLGLDASDPRPYGFDKGMEFEPLTAAKRIDFTAERPRPPIIYDKLLDKKFEGGVADYRQVALFKEEKSFFSFPTYKSVMPSWDNDARKKGKGPTVFYGANPDIYSSWLDRVLRDEHEKKAPIVFVNAWNEWAEGAILEPSRHLGHATLNRTTEILAKYSANPENKRAFPAFGISRDEGTELAVIVHIFYKKEWLHIKKKLKNLHDVKYDLFITITEKNRDLINKIQAEFTRATIKVVPNRGRDIMPFLLLFPRLKEAGYRYLLKLHTKRSTHRSDGDEWLDDLTSKLLPSPLKVRHILSKLQDEAAIIGPDGHFISQEIYIGSNESQMKTILHDRYNDELITSTMDNLKEYGYVAGSMFWARIDALQHLSSIPFIIEEFESERGQIDGTLAHAIERLFSLTVNLNGGKIFLSGKDGLCLADKDDIIAEYKYAS